MGLSGVLAGVLAACGSSPNSGSGPTISLTGTYDGHPIPTTDAFAGLGTYTVNGATYANAGVTVTNYSGACAVAQRDGNPSSQTMLSIGVVASGSTVPPDTYLVKGTPSKYAIILYQMTDASCAQTTSVIALDGHVDITTASGGVVAGDFDVTFVTGERVTGTFSAPVCAIDAGAQQTPAPCGS
jgi:hypothetical protein